MSKDELRPCIVEIVKGKEAETYNGYFHTWVTEACAQISSVYGIVEYKNGSVHKVLPEQIIFTDR